VTLYRTGSLTDKPGAFWTPSDSYAYYVHPKGPLHIAELEPTARVKRLPGDASRTAIEIERVLGQADVLVFRAWDWDTDEYVVLNPHVLRITS
jgi:hypothetical protein